MKNNLPYPLAPFCIEGLAQSMVPKAPKLNLDGYILLEANTNTVIAEFNSDDQISPASMTKGNEWLCYCRSDSQRSYKS